jgi:succinoglycan biosynthesis transport protein ExoP
VKHLALTHTPGVPSVSRVYESASGYASPDAEQLITFLDLLRVAKVHWRAIVLLAIATAILATIVTSLISPVYVGNALLIVDPQHSRIFNEQNNPTVLSNLPSDPTSIENQVQMLQSHALAGQVVDKLNMTGDPDFGGHKPDALARSITSTVNDARGLLHSLGFDTSGLRKNSASPAVKPDDILARQRLREAAINALLGRLDVHQVGLSTVIEVNVRSTNATRAADIANAVSSTYIQNLSSAKSDASEGASKWLADQVTQLARQASAADAAVQQYKAEHGLVDTSNGTAITDQQLGALTAQLVQAQGDEAQANARLARVQQLVHSGHGADATDVVSSPLIAQLRQQESTLIQQKADLSTRYGPMHPAMLNINSQLRDLREKINEEVNRIIGTASNDLTVAAARVAAIKGNMSAATSTTAVQNSARVKLMELQANAASDRAIYQSYLDRLKQTEQQAGLQTSDIRLVSPAAVPMAPVAPKKAMIVGISTLASLVLGFLAALIADRMCAGFRSKREVEATLGVPVLATIPELKMWRRTPKEVVLQGSRHPHSSFSEAIRGLEIGVTFHAGEKAGAGAKPGRAVLVTSALPAEGKTSTTLSLARRLAASGHKVVVIDADLRRPAVATALGLQQVRHSLADYLTLRCSLDEALVPDPGSSAMVLPATFSADATELVSSVAMASLVERLRQIADFVVIDSPPVLAVHDAKLLAQITDGTIFVIRWKKTPREAVAQAMDILREFRTRLIGAALARADTKQQQYYAFGYTGLPALADYHKN